MAVAEFQDRPVNLLKTKNAVDLYSKVKDLPEPAMPFTIAVLSADMFIMTC